jgi:3-methyladenine DNA glycosylase AlkD
MNYFCSKFHPAIMNIKEYHNALNDVLKNAANPVVAAGAKRNMKNQSHFLGVSSPVRKKVLNEFLHVNRLPDLIDLDEFAMLCWDSPQREMQYCCMEIMYRMRKQFSVEQLPLFEKLIQTKGWWDTVDFIALSLAGFVLKNNSQLIDGVIARWQNHENMWMRRSAFFIN